jgi:UDP-4-amino-4,6-dideoxy-N-acetyl-beta-L-altrosamine transaminase
MELIPYGKQFIDTEDVQAVIDILRSDYLTQGPTVKKFEEVLCSKVGAKFGVAVNSATSALHIACLSLNLGPGDYLWSSAITFVASTNCARYCGANVDFVDVDPFDQNISIERLKEKLSEAKKHNKLPKILVAVHFAGHPCDMREIFLLSQEYGFRVIEDASHALGSEYLGALTGGCKYSDITVFSFHPVKIITTGEGGMATTNSEEIADKLRLYSSHGITKNLEQMEFSSDGPWYYEQKVLGFNYRMTDIQAALGISQLNKLPEFLARRKSIVQKYQNLLGSNPLLQLPCERFYQHSSWHLYVVKLNLESLKVDRKYVFEKMRLAGVGVNVHYMPIYLQPYYRSLGFERGYNLNAEQYYERAISLPIFPGLSEIDQAHVIEKLTSILINA